MIRTCSTNDLLKVVDPRENWLAVLLCFFVLCPIGSRAQNANQVSSGTSEKTIVNFSNSFGVYTQLNTTPNLSGSVSATLNVEPGSSLKSDFGGINNELKQNIVVTPTGSSVSIEGMKSVNEYKIAPGTSFSSDIKSLSPSECAASAACANYGDGPGVGSAGSGMQHVMSISIDQSKTSFSNSFSQSF